MAEIIPFPRKATRRSRGPEVRHTKRILARALACRDRGDHGGKEYWLYQLACNMGSEHLVADFADLYKAPPPRTKGGRRKAKTPR